MRRINDENMKNMKKKYRRGELAEEILKGLALGGFIAACFVCPNFAQVAKLFNANDWNKKKRLKQSLYALSKQKLIEFSLENDKLMTKIKITEDGEKRILKYQFEEMQIVEPKKWDKLWRLVIFDIPESKRRARDSLNLKLKELNFYALQKSVFLHLFECKKEIDFIGEYFNVREHIHYFVIKEVENPHYFKNHFFGS